MNIIDFVRESNRIEGILREPTDAEVVAHLQFVSNETLEVGNLVELVSVLQPDARLRDNMSVPCVRVGTHIAPASGPEIREQLQFILKEAQVHYDSCRFERNPNPKRIWELHCDYETLHPFTDGNGRSGRALWLWCMGGLAPLGFLHQFYYQTLSAYR